MSNITLAVDRIKQSIPEEILKEAFVPREYNAYYDTYQRYRNHGPISLDSIIEDKVIREKVAVDLSLSAGGECLVPISTLPREWLDQFYFTVQVPKKNTGGRRIISASLVNYGGIQGYTNNLGFPMSSSYMAQAAAGVFMAEAPLQVTSTGYVHVLPGGENKVLIQDTTVLGGNSVLKCTLSHDEDLENIRPPYVNKFCAMCVMYAKAYCYNTLVIKLDEGAVIQGAALNRIREIIDSYSDQMQMYEEYRDTKWKIVSVLNDIQKYRTRIRRSIPGRG